MEVIHHKHDHQSIQGLTVAGKHMVSSLKATCFFTLVLISESWAQLSIGAPQEEPKLTPLPHPEIAKPAMLEPGVSTWIIVLTALGLLGLLALFVWLLFRKGPAANSTSPPPLKQALERMESLRTQVDQLPPSELAHQVSVILRNYQSGRYDLPAPYRTSEELYGNRAIVNREELKQRFAPISAIYDRIEFAPAPATKVESLDLIDTAIQALHEEKRYQEPRSSGSVPPPSSLEEPSAT